MLKDRKLAIFISVILLFRIVTLVTFPLNSGGDDYKTMMISGESSLTHISTYPFLIGLPYRIYDSLKNNGNTHPEQNDEKTDAKQENISQTKISKPESEEKNTDKKHVIKLEGPRLEWHVKYDNHILIIQHGIMAIGTILILIYMWKRISPFCAVLFGLLYGLDINTVILASWAKPEFFQAIITLISIILAVETYLIERSEKSNGKKLLLYIIAGLFFGLSFITKLLSLPVLIFIIIMVFLDFTKWKHRIVCLGVVILIPIGMYFSYIHFHHKPKAGTKKLVYADSWLYALKIQYFSPSTTVMPENGRWSNFYIYLDTILPHDIPITFEKLFRKVDAIPMELRKPYLEIYDEFLKNPDKKWEYIPPKDLTKVEHDMLYVRISTYMGLPEGQKIWREVFIETIKANPTGFIKDYLKSFFDFLFVDMTKPQTITYNGAQKTSVKIKKQKGYGFVKYDLKPERQFYFANNSFWDPGVKFFSYWRYFHLPAIAKWSIFFLLTILAFIIKDKTITHTRAKIYLICILIYSLSLNAGVNMFHNFRTKEFRMLDPLVCFAIAMGIYWLICFFRNKKGRQKE